MSCVSYPCQKCDCRVKDGRQHFVPGWMSTGSMMTFQLVCEECETGHCRSLDSFWSNGIVFKSHLCGRCQSELSEDVKVAMYRDGDGDWNYVNVCPSCFAAYQEQCKKAWKRE